MARDKAKGKKRMDKASRNLMLGLLAFAGLIVVVVLATPAIDNITIPGTPTREAMPPQRAGIVDLPPVSATVRDNNGDIRNISASVSLDLDERQVRNYDVDDLRAIVMGAVMQLEGEMFENIYDMDTLSDHIRDHLNVYINPDHLHGVHITEIESGIDPIARPPQADSPRSPTWQMN